MLKALGATLTLLAVLVAGVWVLPASHDQGDLSGIWRFRVRLDSGRSTVRFVLRQDGEVLSGTYDGSYGTLPIAGTASGDDIEFSFVIRLKDSSPSVSRAKTSRVANVEARALGVELRYGSRHPTDRLQRGPAPRTR